MLAGSLRWSATAVTGGRVMAVGWRLGGVVGLCRVGSGWAWGFLFFGVCSLVGCGGVGWFCVGSIIARNWGDFRAILVNFLIGWSGRGRDWVLCDRRESVTDLGVFSRKRAKNVQTLSEYGRL